MAVGLSVGLCRTQLLDAHDMQQRAELHTIENARARVSAKTNVEAISQNQDLVRVMDVISAPIRHVDAQRNEGADVQELFELFGSHTEMLSQG